MTDHTSPAAEEFFAAIGRLTISWAHIEAGLDCGIEVAHKILGGNRIEAEFPRTSLHRKLRYLRKWSATIPEPIFQKNVTDLMDDIERSAETRHNLIHGFMVAHAEELGEAEMVRIIHTSERSYDKRQYKVTTTQILEAAVAANKLAGRALRFGTGLQDMVQTLLGSTHK
jgi:hypothetical protein